MHLKSLGKIVSFTWFLLLVTVLPTLCLRLWPSILHFAQALTLQTGVKPVVWIFLFTTSGTNLLVLTTYNLVMWWVYKAKLPFFEKMRVSPEVSKLITQKQWPWEEDREKWKQTLRETLKMVFINALVVNIVGVGGEVLLHDLQYTFRTEDWPSTTQILAQFAIFTISTEFFTFWSHLLFHHPLLYPIHKKHHEYHTTVCITATYANPIEYVFSNLLSVFGIMPVISLFTNLHCITMSLWIVFALMYTAQVHSGYSFPWGVGAFMPFKNTSAFHDFHHSHNSGNYGSMLTIMDSLMKTDAVYRHYEKKRKEI